MNNQEIEFNQIKKELKLYSYLLTFSFIGITALILLGIFGWLSPTGYKILSIVLGIMVIYLFTLKIKVTKKVNNYVGNIDRKYGKNNDVLKFGLDIIFKSDTNYKNFTSKVRGRQGR